MPEFPKSLEDEFRRLAAESGDGDITPPPDDAAPETASVPATPETAERVPAPTKPGSSPRVNLDELEDFRRWKAEADKREAALKKQLAEHEAAAAAQRQAAEQARMADLNARLGQTYDDTERARLLDEAAALRGRAYYEQWQAWEQHKSKRLSEEGLNPQDERFQKQYSGEAGALEFERDVLAAAKEKYQREAQQLKEAATPAAIAALVRAELAKLAQAQGLNYVDTGDGTTPSRESDLAAAIEDFNQGRIPYSEFKRRTG